MAATPTAMYSQNSTQTGSTLAGAFPQVNGYAENLDILQIESKKGKTILAAVDYLGNVYTGLVLTSVAVVGAVTTYNGTITNGGTNAFVGRKVRIAGFSNAGNNGDFVITGSSTTTIVVATTSQTNETHAGTAIPFTGKNTRVGQFLSNFALSDSPTAAQLFADAFSNPSKLDIFQAVNIGGNAHYYLDYQGVAHGS